MLGSISNDFDICNCDCHRVNDVSGVVRVVHVMACCQTCISCGNRIRIFEFDTHVGECSKERQEMFNRVNKSFIETLKSEKAEK